MTSNILTTALATAGLAAVLTVGAALGAEERPTLLGDFQDWHVYSLGSGANRLCYALSEPKQMSPAGANRGQVSFMVSSWPGRQVRNEPSVVPGYPYREDGKVQVEVGSDKFIFFTKNDSGTGGAWAEVPADEPKLITAMRRGATMTVTGTSARGTLTRDNYSLSGVSAALDKIGAECK